MRFGPARQSRRSSFARGGPTRRRTAVLVAVVALGVIPVACADADTEPNDDVVTSIRIANPYESGTPFNTCGMLELDEAIGAAGGGLDVEIFSDGLLGSEGETVEQVVTGELDGTVAGPAFLGKWYDPAAVMEAYYVFDSLESMNAAADGPEGTQLWDGFLDETGVRVVDTWWLGARHVMSTEPVRTPEDLSGVRMRVPDNQLHVRGAEAMGATPMPVPLGETYIGLQQGLISAVEGPMNTSDANGFHEVANYITLTGHVRTPVPVLISETVWQRIDEQDRQILTAELERLGNEAQRCTQEQDAEILRDWVDSGAVEIVDDADIDAFREAVRGNMPEQFEWADVYHRIAD